MTGPTIDPMTDPSTNLTDDSRTNPITDPHGPIQSFTLLSCLLIFLFVGLDKAPRLSIRIVIWILPSDTDTVFVNSIKISANTETAMLFSTIPIGS